MSPYRLVTGSGGWRSYTVAIGLLLVGDLATTIAAVEKYGLSGEMNPVMRWLLANGMGLTVVVHVFVLGLCVIGYSKIRGIGDSLDAPLDDSYKRWCQRWVLFLVIAGILVVANNVVVLLT